MNRKPGSCPHPLLVYNSVMMRRAGGFSTMRVRTRPDTVQDATDISRGVRVVNKLIVSEF